MEAIFFVLTTQSTKYELPDQIYLHMHLRLTAIKKMNKKKKGGKNKRNTLVLMLS